MSAPPFSRKKLQHQNLAAIQDPPVLGKLDSSLKKNLGFIKKIRTACSSESINESILNDIRTLSLEKYLSEIIPAFYDRMVVLTKAEDISAAVTIFSSLFQRFQTAFSAPMLALLINCIFSDSSPARERSTCVAVVFELNLVSIASRFSDCAPEYLSDQASRVATKFSDHNVTIVSLRTLMGAQAESSGLPIMASFIRRFEDELVKSRDVNLGTPTEGSIDDVPYIPKNLVLPVEPEEICPSPVRVLEASEKVSCQQLLTHIQQLLERYCTKNLQEYERLQRQERKERRTAENTAIKYGKDFENALLDTLAQDVAFHKLHLQPMCSSLGLEFPQEKPAPTPVPPEVGFVWWSTPQEKAFYDEIPVLDDLLADKRLHTKAYAKLSEPEKVQVFLDSLAGVSREVHLEKASVALNTYVPNNKATHNRILRFFIDSAKTDALSLLAKFIKINSAYFESTLLDLITQIDKGFRSQMYTGKINYRNVVFFGELVKFKLVPSHLIFHKLRNMTVNLFSSNNIEILMLFYERLGKFLLYEPEYRENTHNMLQLLREKSRHAGLSQYQRLYLNNLFLNIDSFTGKVPVQDQTQPSQIRSDSHEFFHQIYTQVLNPKTYFRVAKVMEHVDFSKSPHAASDFVNVFRTPENLRSDTYLLAAKTMLHFPKQSRFVVHQVVHMLTQQLISGLEENDYRKNVARTALVRFLATMCNAGVLPFEAISDVLFKIVCHGYRNNFPTPDQNPAIDPRDNYFRVQLCSTLLKSVDLERARAQGLLFSGLKSVESFLYFLQYFCYCKIQPFPRDIEFGLSDVLIKARDLGLTVEWPSDISGALKRLQDFMMKEKEKERGETKGNGKSDEREREEDAQEGGEGDGDGETLYRSNLSGLYSESESESESEESGVDESGDLEELADEELEDEEMEDEELDSDESHSSDSDFESDSEIKNESDGEAERRQFQRSAHDFAVRQFDESISSIIKEAATPRGQTPLKMPDPAAYSMQETTTTSSTSTSTPSSTCVSGSGPGPGPGSFRFVSRSSQPRDLHLPSNSRFVSNFSNKQAQEKLNREKISNLIINMYQ